MLISFRNRDFLVLALAAAGGGLDAWSFFGLGQTFVANMTGNTVLLGFSAAASHWGRLLDSALSLGLYLLGVFSGSLLAGPVRKATKAPVPEGFVPWPSRLVAILGLECCLTLGAAMAALVLAPHTESPLARLLIAIVAFAVGLQSAAMNAVQLPGVVTTYITGTWTTLVAGLAQPSGGEAGSVWARKWLLQAGVVGVYCGAAFANGLVARWATSRWMGCVPVLLLLVVVGWSARKKPERAGPERARGTAAARVG